MMRGSTAAAAQDLTQLNCSSLMSDLESHVLHTCMWFVSTTGAHQQSTARQVLQAVAVACRALQNSRLSYS
jgi:hypothetical protein